MNRYAIVFASMVVMGACSAGTQMPDRGERLAQLKQVDSCDTLLGHLKSQAISQMEQQLDETLAQYMSYNYCGGYGGHGGFYGDDYDYDGMDASNRAPGAPSAGAFTAEAGGESASEYSETNNQVQGVAEADFIKNDGSHIYVLADGRFLIVDAWPADQSHVLSTHAIEGEPKRLFVHQDKALIYSSLDPVETGAYYGYYGGDCTYGYNCDFTGDGHQLKITVLDISDRAHPVLERELRLSGSYLNARRIGTAVHTAVVFPAVTFSGIEYYPEILNECWSANPPNKFQIYQAFKELKWENRRLIEEADIGSWMPSVSDTRYSVAGAQTSDTLLESCENYYKSGLSDGQSFLTLLSLDMTRSTDAQATTVVGRPGAVYASAEALYISSRIQGGDISSYGGGDDAPAEASTVHKFRLVNDPPGCSYAGSGVVKGRVLSQFSMDEHEGYLRMATTTGHVPSPDVHSTMTVLAEQDGVLVRMGTVDEIAPTEDIRSVRFNGTTAFIVTFKKTDPLFTFDLSDPADPRIVGELKIPGYSTYMHLLGPDHLLTIGYDAEDHDSFAYFQGLMLQIFDISDLADPRLIHKEIIGTRGSTSDAATNHLAFNYFAPAKLLAIPITVCEDSGGGGSYGDTMSFSGLLVYDVSVEGGFSLRGGVAHVDPDEVEDHYSYCRNWWTDSNSIVKRSVFMDDFVYSVAPTRIKVQDLDALGEDLVDLNLARQARSL
jgi:Beta propeller domain